jgi:hypothetical protein
MQVMLHGTLTAQLWQQVKTRMNPTIRNARIPDTCMCSRDLLVLLRTTSASIPKWGMQT